ncbi:MAG: efflux RND transporter permease subunit [Acidobacteria bacterium]|nr:efflux RND transporter permease subunit [Acidobacteriota bacterium]
MFLSEASVKRPIAMGALIITLTLLGLNSARKLGLELMPKIDVPYITVITAYPGATPEEIETDIAKRIEDAVVTVDGLKHVTSSSMENFCQTLLEFHLDVDVDIAATDVREKLDLIRADFPEDVEDPIIQKFDINAAPIVNLALTGDLPIDEIYDYADNTLRDRITTIPGVADVQLVGGAKREVQVQLDRRKLAARGLSGMDVVRAIQQGVRTIPAGNLRDGSVEYSVKFDADYENIEDIGELEIANIGGQRSRIKDFGTAVMATDEMRQQASIDGRPAVAIRAIKKSDANAVEVVGAVKAAMTDLERFLPGGLELVWVADDGRFIEAMNHSAWINVVQGILLTSLILFLFLYNVRSLIVVGITMPLTIVIGLFFMDLSNLTLNISTMIAVGLSVGILVTNSIVVLEAIVKRFSRTGNARDAARLGTSEAAIAVLASVGTNVVVLFPLVMMHSMIGLFIKALALTMLIMTAVSLLISFTLTPLLCSVLLVPPGEKGRSLLRFMERGWNRGFEGVIRAYRALLEFNERHRPAAVLIILLVAGLFLLSMSAAGWLGTSMVSEADQGKLFVKLEFPTEYNLEQTARRVREAESRMRGVPELKHVLTTIGKVEGTIGQTSEGVHLAQLLLKFSERDERGLTMQDILGEVRSRLEDYPGAIVTVNIPVIVGGQSSDIELEIIGEEYDILDGLALKTGGLIAPFRGIRDIDTTVRSGKPELRILPRREVLSDRKIPATEIGLNLRANLEGLTAGTFKKDARNYDIVVKLREETGKEQVDAFLLPGEPGRPVLLNALAYVEEGRAPVLLTRKDKRRVSKVFANLDPGLPLGTAVNRISETVDTEGGLPPQYDYQFAGRYEVMAEGLEGLAEAGIISLVLVVLMLAAILESFKQPAMILVTVPLALIGTVWGLFWTGNSLGIFEIMSVVMMIGIVVNNAILIVDQFNVHVREGVPRHKAMIEAACERFRPVVMITIAAVLGMLPLAFGQGIGAETRNGAGISMLGGILSSGVLTLIVLPVLYDLFTVKNRNSSAGGPS